MDASDHNILRTQPRTHRRCAPATACAALLALVVGCTDQPPPAAPGTPKPTHAVSSVGAQQGPNGRLLRDELRDLAQQNPDFAGVFFDSTGALTVAYAGDGLPAASQGAVVRWAVRYTGVGSETMAPRLRRVPFRYVTLDSAFRRIQSAVADVEGVTSLEIDGSQGRILIGVAELGRAAAVRAVGARFGVPAAMIAVERREPQAPEQFTSSDGTLRGLIRGTVAGMNISRGIPRDSLDCSLSLNIFRKDETGYVDYDQPYMLTAQHCAGTREVVDGEVWGQPYVDSPIAEEFESAPFLPAGSFNCPYAQRCLVADAVIAKYTGGVVGFRSTTARSQEVRNGIAAPPFTGTSSTVPRVMGALRGQTVTKIGRTTGETRGVVSGDCVDVQLFYAQTGETLRMICQGQANYNSGKGDSGGLVWVPYDGNPNGTTPRLVGIHIAGAGSGVSGVRTYTPFGNITSALGQEWAFY